MNPVPVDPDQLQPKQWTSDDVARAAAAGRHDLIDQARAAGQLADVLAAGTEERRDPLAAPLPGSQNT